MSVSTTIAPTQTSMPDAGGQKPTAAESIELDVHVLPSDSALEFGLDWLAFTMDKTNDSKSDTVRLTIDYSTIRYAFGGDWAERLQLVRLANCGAESPKLCDANPEVMTMVSNDTVNNLLVVDVSLTVGIDGVGAGLGSRGVTRRSMVDAPNLYGLSSGVGGQNGDWGATSLGRVGQWGVSGATGSFTWAYPIATPAPLAGVVPSLSLSYNSAALDGMTNDANNQGSWVGAGWDLSTGFIERSYRGCFDDGLTNFSGAYAGLQCWYTDAAGQRDHLSISLNGQSSRLVPLTINGNDFRLEDDPGWRVTRAYGGACVGGDPTYVLTGKGGPHVDNDNEYFVVTTPDGVQYTFGCGREPTTSAYTNSVWTLPVVGHNPGEPCYDNNINQAWCYQAYRWNLDRIAAPMLTNSDTGATGTAVTTIAYSTEVNWYDTNLAYYGEIKPYVRAGYVESINYTKVGGSESVDPPAKVVFRVENRCTSLGPICDTYDPAANPSLYPDVPVDLICTASACTKNAASFFTTKHLVAIDTLVKDSSITTGSAQGYRLLDRIRITTELPWTGSADVLQKLFVRTIQRKASKTGVIDTGADDPDNCGVSAECTPAIRFDSFSSLLQNRVVPNGSKMQLWRIDSVKDELGAETVVTYGQPDPCSPVPASNAWPTNNKDCYPVKTIVSYGPAVYEWTAFNKYLVTKIEEFDRTGAGSATMTTSYTYLGGAGWAWDNNETRPTNLQSWSQFRGYSNVVTRFGPSGDQRSSRTYYYRGLNGDYQDVGNPVRVATVPDTVYGSVADDPRFVGRVREVATLGVSDTNSSIQTTSYNTFSNGGAAGVQPYWGVYASSTENRIYEGGIRLLTTQTNIYVDSTYGTTRTVHELGDVATTTDDRCSSTSYLRNTSLWITSLPTVSSTYSGGVNGSGDCNGTIVASQVTTYQLSSSPTTTVPRTTKGLVSGTSTYGGTTTFNYVDTYGRLTSTVDPIGTSTTGDPTDHISAVAYSPSSGYPTTLTATNALGHQTITTLDPRGSPLTVTDPNGKVTSGEYDALGRLVKVKRPGQYTATHATVEYQYALNTQWPSPVTPSTVTTIRLVAKAGDPGTSVDLTASATSFVDGFGRAVHSRQQTAGGLVASSTSFDSHGVATRTTAPYSVSGTVNTFSTYPTTPARESTVTQDILGRVATENTVVSGTTMQTTTHSYLGLYTTVFPPDPTKAATRTKADPFGRVEESAVVDADPTPPSAPAPESPLQVLDVAVAVKSDGTQGIFQIGSDRQLYYHESSPVAAWTALTLIGGTNGTNLDRVAVAVLSSGAYAVVVRNTSGSMYVTRQSTPGGTFGAFTQIAGTSNDVSIAVNSAGNLAVASVNSDGSASVINETSPGTWGSWTALSGGNITRISLARYLDGALAAVVRTSDSYVYTKIQTSPGGPWQSSWFSRGCCVTDVGATISQTTSPGILVVYGVGTDAVAYRTYEISRGGSWTSWASMGGSGFINISAGRLTNGCGVEVTQHTSGIVKSNNESPCGTWSGWIQVVRQTPSPGVDVATAVKPDGSQAIFQVMADRQIYFRESSSTQGWTALAAVAWTDFARVSATSLSDGRLVLLARTVNGQLLLLRQSSPGMWGSWEWIGGNSVDIGLSTDNAGALVFVTANPDGSATYVKETGPGVWSWATSLAGSGVTRVSLARYTDGSLAAAVVNSSNQVYTKKQTSPGGSWESSWTSRGTGMTDVAATISQSSPGILVLYGAATAQNIQRSYEITYGGSWTSWNSTGGSGYVSIAAGRLSNGCGIQVAQRANGTVDTNLEVPCGTWSGWVAPATAAVTRYTYNTVGAVDTVTDPGGNVTDTDYDLLGRATKINDPNRGVTTMTYDLNSNLLTTTDARGVTLTTTYDALNRPTALNNGATLLTAAAFDASGEKGLLDWSASYFEGAEYKTDITGYNDTNQPTSMAIIVPSNSHTSGLAGTYNYTTTYRGDGTPVTETYPAVGGLPAEQVTYGYGATGEANSTVGQDLDGTGAPTGSPHVYVLSTTYDTIDRVAARQLGDTAGSTPNVVRGYSYDSLGRLSGLTAHKRLGEGSQTTIQSTTYTFDANNNVASRLDNVSNQRECFTYDTRNRLVRAYTQGAGTCAGTFVDTAGTDPYERTYTYDGLTRMTSMATRTSSVGSFTNRNYTYAATSPGGCTSGTASAKPHAPSTITNYGTSSYDCDGNTTARTSPVGVFTQTWDAQSRLTQVAKTDSPTSTSTYIYGPDRQRLIQEVGTTRTAYLPHQQTVSVGGGAATVARYYTTGGATAAARRTGSNPGTYFMGGDNQGSVSWMLNAATSAVTSTRYFPYGEVRGTPNQMPTDHGFVGQVEDDATGVSYLNNRYYDTGSAVFLSVDPLVDQTASPFAYGNGNPITLSDPSGLCVVTHGMHSYDDGRGQCNAYVAGQGVNSAEVASWNLDTRRAWINDQFDWARSRGFDVGEWFDNISAILDFFDRHGLARPGSWEGDIDASILTAIGNGLVSYVGGGSSRRSTDGRSAWYNFFAALDNSGDGISESERSTLFKLWGTAEQYATDLGVASVQSRGIEPANDRLESLLIGFGNQYRSALANDDPLLLPGSELLTTSLMVCSGEGGCFPASGYSLSSLSDVIDPRNGENIGWYADAMYDDGFLGGFVRFYVGINK